MSPKCLLASRSEGNHQKWEIRMSVYCNTDENSRILSPFKLRLVFEAHIKWTGQRRQRQPGARNRMWRWTPRRRMVNENKERGKHSVKQTQLNADD